MTKLVEATNEYSLVEAEMTYGMILSEATVCAVAFFVERGIFMARKNRKHQHAEMVRTSTADAVGYVRLSVANREESSSIQNQKFIIECWGEISIKFLHRITISIMVSAANGLTAQRSRI